MPPQKLPCPASFTAQPQEPSWLSFTLSPVPACPSCDHQSNRQSSFARDWGGYIRVEKCHITFPVEHVSKWQNLQRDFKVQSIQWPPSEQGLANGRWACRVLVIRLLDSGELGMLVRASGRLKLVINLSVYSCQEFVLGR